jgi:hypothetical protein
VARGQPLHTALIHGQPHANMHDWVCCMCDAGLGGRSRGLAVAVSAMVDPHLATRYVTSPLAAALH